MATIKDAKQIIAEKLPPVKILFSYVFFYLHFFIWLMIIACFGIIAEF